MFEAREDDPHVQQPTEPLHPQAESCPYYGTETKARTDDPHPVM